MSTEQKPDEQTRAAQPDNVVPFNPAGPGNDFPATPEAARSLAGDPETVPEQDATAETPAPQELNAEQKVLLAWTGLTLAYSDLQHRGRALIETAQVHAPTAGKRNARILVFADRLEDLANLLGQKPPTSEEAMQFWQDRMKDTQEVAELRRMGLRLVGIVQRLEAQAGVAPREDNTPDLVKLEAMTAALIDIVHQQTRLIGELKGQLKGRMGGQN